MSPMRLQSRRCCVVPCSKNDALRLLRKLVVAGVLAEETYRQDNQYGGVLSYLAVNEGPARALQQGSLPMTMPFAVGVYCQSRAFPQHGKSCRLFLDTCNRYMLLCGFRRSPSILCCPNGLTPAWRR